MGGGGVGVGGGCWLGGAAMAKPVPHARSSRRLSEVHRTFINTIPQNNKPLSFVIIVLEEEVVPLKITVTVTVTGTFMGT